MNKYYRVTGKQDGIDYGRFQAESEVQAIVKMLDDAGVEDYNAQAFAAEEINFLLSDAATYG